MPDEAAVVPAPVPTPPAPPAPPATYPPSVAPPAPPASPWTNFLGYVGHAWQHFGVLFVGAVLVEEATAYLHGELLTLGNVETVAITAVAGVILSMFHKPLTALAQ